MAPKATSTLEDARNPFLMGGLDCFQVLINTLKYSQMLTNYLLYARSTIVMVWRTQGRAFVKVGWSHEEPRQKYKCSMYNNILTLKPKANFYNNWVLPVEKHISHFQQVVLRKKPGRPDSEESFGGKRHVRCQKYISLAQDIQTRGNAIQYIASSDSIWNCVLFWFWWHSFSLWLRRDYWFQSRKWKCVCVWCVWRL